MHGCLQPLAPHSPALGRAVSAPAPYDAIQFGRTLSPRRQEQRCCASGTKYDIARRPKDIQLSLINGSTGTEQRQQQPEGAERNDDHQQPGYDDGACREDLAQPFANWV